jgi:hypothetical protein
MKKKHRNCVRLAVSTVAFSRGLFPKDAFAPKNYGGVTLEVLRPIDQSGKVVNEGALRVVRLNFITGCI